jgi:hypothetical protein
MHTYSAGNTQDCLVSCAESQSRGSRRSRLSAVTTKIVAGWWRITESGSPRSRAKWESALRGFEDRDENFVQLVNSVILTSSNPNPRLSAIHGLKRVVCEVDAVGQNAQNEIVEGVRQIWTLAAHTFEIGAGQSE